MAAWEVGSQPHSNHWHHLSEGQVCSAWDLVDGESSELSKWLRIDFSRICFPHSSVGDQDVNTLSTPDTARLAASYLSLTGWKSLQGPLILALI